MIGDTQARADSRSAAAIAPPMAFGGPIIDDATAAQHEA